MLPYRPAPRFSDRSYVERAQVVVCLMIFAAVCIDFIVNSVWHGRINLFECAIVDSVDVLPSAFASLLYVPPMLLAPIATHDCNIHYPWRWTALSFNCSAR